MEVPEQGGDLGTAVTCKQCGRTFASATFLRKHYARRHPDKDYDYDFPTEKELKERQAREDRKEQELAKANQERLFGTLKTDLLTQMTSSVKTLEKEISGIRSE